MKSTFLFGELFAMPGLSGLYVEVSNCESEGSVRAVSRDPAAEPHIEHRFFSNPHDLDRILGGAKAAFAAAFEVKLGESMKCELPPLPMPRFNATSEALRAHFLDFHATDYHPSGTLKMGAGDDPLAVVDDHCRLRGIANLYVADASVMPTVPRANINLPTMMIGERVADFIRSEM